MTLHDAFPGYNVPMPERDMDETINSDMEFEEAVAALLHTGPVTDEVETDESEPTD
jgi:hypothetical protein